MKINIVFLQVKNSRISRADRFLIEKTIRKYAGRVAKLLKLKTDNLTFTLLPFWNENRGFAQSKEWIRLTIPLKWKSKKMRQEYFEKNLPSLVCHEMHHISREYVGFLEKKYRDHILMNSLVSEGLAVSFSEEQIKSFKSKSAKYSEKNLKKWLSSIKKEKWSKKYSHDEWFYGKKGKPNALGYKIGKYIIDKVKENHPDLNACKLARIETKKIIKLSGLKL